MIEVLIALVLLFVDALLVVMMPRMAPVGGLFRSPGTARRSGMA